MVRLDTPLAKTIETRMLAALRRSKYGRMTFPELVKRSKCDRWWELSKHVIGWMRSRYLVETMVGNVVSLRLSPENYIGMTRPMDYRKHLESLSVDAQVEVNRLKELILADFGGSS